MWRVVAAALMATFGAAGAARAQSLVLSFDDGPSLQATPLLSPAARNRALLDTLARHRVPAVLFVTLGFGADRPEGRDMAQAWGDAGHRIGNHTVSHLDLDDPRVTLERYQREVLDCDAAIRTLPGYRRWLRYTFLHEGNTPEKRDGMRSFLWDHSYRRAQVDLDSGDWMLEGRLIELLAADPQADTTSLRRAYLRQVEQRALALREQAAPRDPPRVVLLHHNLITALWLTDVIALLQSQGWTFGDPDAAFGAATAGQP